MDLLDRLLGHDHWTTRQLLSLCRGLSDEQLRRQFPFGHRSLQATAAHIVWNMEVWTDLMAGSPVRKADGDSIPELIERLDRVAADLSRVARGVTERNAWDEHFTDTLDNPPRQKSYGGGVAHIITHSMHHRAQLISMLRALGVPGVPEGDAFSWENRGKNQ